MRDEEIFQECVTLAMESNCKKLGFGAVLYDCGQEKIIARCSNNAMKPFEYLCDPECIRDRIPSRTQSMIGACAHAEEQCLWLGAAVGLDLSTCEIYVQGVNLKTGDLLTKTDETFTCIRCATQMYLAKLKAINIWLEDGWLSIPTDIALVQSYEYASGALEADSA
jgi:hypothetical protein